MTWWAWTLLWIALVLGSLVVFFLIGRSLWRKAGSLIRELGTAADRLSAVTAELNTLAGGPAAAEQPAIFSDPAALRAERAAAEKARRRSRGR